MASTLLVGARSEQGRRGVVDADERQHEPRRVVRSQFGYSTICSEIDMPPPHSRGQCGTAYPALCSSVNQDF